jgi:glycopeptide antibiotics resistance protein
MIRISFLVFLLPACALWMNWRWKRVSLPQTRAGGRREVWVNLFFLYSLMVAYVTLFPLTVYYNIPRHVNWVPFVEMKWLLYRPHVAVLNLAGNVVMFAPLGFLLPILCPQHRNILKVTALGLLLSVGIEFLQYLTGAREADIDDVMLNTVGTAVGCALYMIWSKTKELRT